MPCVVTPHSPCARAWRCSPATHDVTWKQRAAGNPVSQFIGWAVQQAASTQTPPHTQWEARKHNPRWPPPGRRLGPSQAAVTRRSCLTYTAAMGAAWWRCHPNTMGWEAPTARTGTESLRTQQCSHPAGRTWELDATCNVSPVPILNNPPHMDHHAQPQPPHTRWSHPGSSLDSGGNGLGLTQQVRSRSWAGAVTSHAAPSPHTVHQQQHHLPAARQPAAVARPRLEPPHCICTRNP